MHAAAERSGGRHAQRRDRKPEAAGGSVPAIRRAALRRRTPRPSAGISAPPPRGRPPGAARQAASRHRGHPATPSPGRPRLPARGRRRPASGRRSAQGVRSRLRSGTARRPRPASVSPTPNGKRRPRGGGAAPGAGQWRHLWAPLGAASLRLPGNPAPVRLVVVRLFWVWGGGGWGVLDLKGVDDACRCPRGFVSNVIDLYKLQML